jgi:hypothetical protein
MSAVVLGAGTRDRRAFISAAPVSINTRLRPPAATSFAHTSSPWTTGKVAIEHDHVVIVDEGVRQACFAIEGDVDRDPRLSQAGGDGLCKLLVVLDHKHPHRPLLLSSR